MASFRCWLLSQKSFLSFPISFLHRSEYGSSFVGQDPLQISFKPAHTAETSSLIGLRLTTLGRKERQQIADSDTDWSSNVISWSQSSLSRERLEVIDPNMASNIFLYWGSGSPPCWRVMMCLEEKGLLGYRSKFCSFEKKEHKSEEVLKINPRGQVNL